MHTSPVTSVAFSPTSAVFVSAGADGIVHKWYIYSGEHQEEPKDQERARMEKEQEKIEQDGEGKHKEREILEQTQHNWDCNASPEQIYGAPGANIGPPLVIITGPNCIEEGPSRKGEYPSHIEGDLPYMTRPSDNTMLPQSITPLAVSSNHHILYSHANESRDAIVDPILDSYHYVPLTPANPMSLHEQSTPMDMASPEPWNKPNDPPRRLGANKAAICAHIRAVEQFRKLQLGEDDDEEEMEIQRK
ncbi:hypothetical protein RSOLAG1IB_11644 [Rhizoctonia solani AG-1 IB]|uniref:Uncharacterized protein n=1 Tax=Thanatephorus cucumeris (strain AG1-IB / isolate 7/3/14) TaxID=1108050 RepID=M5C7Y7_THACB|nr:hypothetical protein BN14_09280 [Rhizoctonia solani AG-1 IB]CEL54398.1 hypothetical protein RSOLAG1IB_11644 [Rhizoctonia solani AG-1 IB]